MSRQPTIIKVRRGINGFKYSVCDKDGYKKYFNGICEKTGAVSLPLFVCTLTNIC